MCIFKHDDTALARVIKSVVFVIQCFDIVTVESEKIILPFGSMLKQLTVNHFGSKWHMALKYS